MSDPRTERVREILDLAMERPSGEREAFVAGAAGTDAAARAEVMSLLAALGPRPDALEPPTIDGADAAVAEPLTGLEFGTYLVGERIGEGGMGVVYAARDTRLERTVAVKTLPPALARNLHRWARLEQEARLLAALNHPNIAAIHGVEDTARGPVLVLEFVPGRTLAQELADRRWSIEESVQVAVQIARGLESAHAAGIVHRDLKPANIKITPQGVAKILDLGVAKSASDRLGRASVATDPGMIVGSAAYMSPEQTRGRPVDRRTDMWAFGCVLYEMLAGRRAFEGATSSDTLAAVLTGQPDWARLPAETPAGVRRMLMRCIERDPARRMRDAGDAILELEGTGEEPVASIGSAGKGRWIVAAMALSAVIALAVARPWEARRAAEPPARVVMTIETPGALEIEAVGGCIALSPDGRSLVYVARDTDGRGMLYLRQLDSLESVAIRGTEDGHAPFFSPDGRWVGFLHGKPNRVVEIKRVPLEGGPAQRMATTECSSASWADDGSLLVSISGVLKRISATGEEVRAVLPTKNDQLELHSQPEMLPGSGKMLFTCWRKEATRWRPRVEIADLGTGQRRVLVEDATMPRFARDAGMLVYRAGVALMAVAMNPEHATLSGEPRPVIDSLAGEASYFARSAISANDVVAYVPGDAPAEQTDLAWFHADGTFQTVLTGETRIWSLRLSPDASRVAYTINDAPEFGLWVLDFKRGNATKLFTPARPFFPVWTPDGARIAFQNQEPGGANSIAWTPADGSGKPEIIFTPAGGVGCLPTGFSHDGRLMLIMVDDANDQSDIFVIDMDSDRAPKRLLGPPADRSAARFSPDGKLVAYTSSETGRAEVYIHPFPALDLKLLVSADGGERPSWSADGTRIYWRFNDTIFSADVHNDGTLRVGLPRVVVKGLPGLRYDTAPDGERFIMGRPRGLWGPQTRINVVVNALTPQQAKAGK